jgi:hypothetical protein
MNEWEDRRPGFYEFRPLRGCVEQDVQRRWFRKDRLVWWGIIERKFVTWDKIRWERFLTASEAEAWVFRTLTEMSTPPDRRYVEPPQ